MGNERSQLSGLEINEKAVEVTDYWTHSSAVLYNENVTCLSVFIGDSYFEGSLWKQTTPLERMTKNLMLHRHPCILKYISSWNKGSKHYLAVESVKPLAQVINSQSSMQICIGLYSVLKAVTFLHEKAMSTHNNICSASIYVSGDGSWKLAGLEFLCRFDKLTADYLVETRQYRYDKAVDPTEETLFKEGAPLDSSAIDKYAFAVLAEELFLSCTNLHGDVPCLEEFRQFCKAELRNENITLRPSLVALLEHPYFTHDFVVIYSFLTELALKSDKDKLNFFSHVCDKLRCFPEEVVARQLGGLLLSRLVLLDKTAHTRLLPYLLVPRQTTLTQTDASSAIFSADIFKQSIVPRLLHIFCVRDAQIRLLLLVHFKHYMLHFSRDQLQNDILPELLIGIKDTNERLVSATLRALAELVPVLGATAVIGGRRLRLFTDGRPARAPRPPPPPMPERLSPDGGEDVAPPPALAERPPPEPGDDHWSDDWGVDERPRQMSMSHACRPDHAPGEPDFFLDMEPVIEKASKFFVPCADSDRPVVPKLTLSVSDEDQTNEEGWTDDLSWVAH